MFILTEVGLKYYGGLVGEKRNTSGQFTMVSFVQTEASPRITYKLCGVDPWKSHVTTSFKESSASYLAVFIALCHSEPPWSGAGPGSYTQMRAHPAEQPRIWQTTC